MSRSASRVLYLVVCAAPPAQRIDELVKLAQGAGWDVCLIPSPTAATWLDLDRLTDLSGHPVLFQHRLPAETAALPPADAIGVVPATFNTINKWAAGINDTHALGVLNESLGLGVPVLAAPYVKQSLAAHPAFSDSLDRLRAAGVRLIPNEAILPETNGSPFRWSVVLDAINQTS